MLVVDASFIVRATVSTGGLVDIAGEPLIAPGILWSETPSVLRELSWRGTISAELARSALKQFLDAPIKRRTSSELTRRAWSVAERLGWAKTYDAEYVALAELLRCRLLTIDVRLQRGAARLVDVIGPTDL